MNYTMKENGFYLDHKFISLEDISKLELDILKVSNCKTAEEFSNHCVNLDKTNKDDLYNLNKYINRHHIVTTLQTNLLRSLEKNDLFYNDYFPVYLGGGFLFGLPQDHRLTYSWHQESNYMPNFEVLYNAWLPVFFENNIENGTMSIINKSSSSGRLPYERVDKPGGFCDLITDVSSFNLDKDNITCEAKPGEAFVFDQNTIHRSNYNSNNLTRFSITVRYAFSKKITAVDNWKTFY